MTIALRPLQPCLGSLLRRCLIAARPVTPRYVPTYQKGQHANIAHRSKHQIARGGTGRLTTGSSPAYDTAQVVDRARQAVKQTFAPHSVVCGQVRTEFCSTQDTAW